MIITYICSSIGIEERGDAKCAYVMVIINARVCAVCKMCTQNTNNDIILINDDDVVVAET